jgi:hypothetical protein
VSVQIQLARLDCRDIQDVGDHSEHELTHILDRRNKLPLVRIQHSPRFAFQELGIAENDSQRGSQIMCGHAQQAILLLIQPLQLGVPFGHLALEVHQLVIQPAQFLVGGKIMIGAFFHREG